MARVSQAHLDARRRQILDGARRCFTSNGFHATSMSDVFKETGLSSGAVYRYFRSKEELIMAVAVDAFGAMREAFAKAAHETPLRPLDEVISVVLSHALAEQSAAAGKDGPAASAELILQVWGEARRSEPLGTALREGYGSMRVVWGEFVEAYQDAGLMRADIPTDHVVRTLMAVAQGFIIQQALFGDTSSEMLRNGLRAVMTMRTDED